MTVDGAALPRERPGDTPSDDEGARLQLLLPDTLPVTLDLAAADRLAMREALAELLAALALADRTAGLARIERLLSRVEDGGLRPATVTQTGTPADAAKVDDFDAYFRVDRVATDRPAFALLRGLLQTARAVIGLFGRTSDLPPQRMDQQVAGFVAWSRLLARSCDLGELS
ncbi:hypothetical protein [Methylobrevis pamukkalensis]|uniref:Uncharacterized protein n=1 Tax=Methylobrevis pamukkalensis TaxID=1439726 RepID=A0A1E3H763_9HYPH|nr:hypothetical protein [Methylobrevis pamukkalensis]ODN72173.1 hypothetical protein A6302_00471 [Methylobrevis pamukkalensis]